MKIEVKDDNYSFKPFSITLTFESLDEVYNMWHRCNDTNDKVRLRASKTYPMPDVDFHSELWGILNRKITKI